MDISARRKKILGLSAILVLVLGGGLVLLLRTRPSPRRVVRLYGTVDIRQIELAFDDRGRVGRILVEEGDRVHKGAVLATLVPARFRDAVARARARVETATAVLSRLLAGTRPERIREARAALAAARARERNARITWKRQRALAAQGDVTAQRLDDATEALRAARAELARARAALALALKGPREQDIAAARARLRADRAALALAGRALADTRLVAPADAVVEDRILEPGDMATPALPVLTLALDNPVWVRAYLPEPELGFVRPGMRAWIRSDSFPHRRFRGWVGFVSPTAEFTPRTVETTQLRTELVYRVRVYACNPRHRLRLGMPVTVRIPLVNNRPGPLPAHSCRERPGDRRP